MAGPRLPFNFVRASPSATVRGSPPPTSVGAGCMSSIQAGRARSPTCSLTSSARVPSRPRAAPRTMSGSTPRRLGHRPFPQPAAYFVSTVSSPTLAIVPPLPDAAAGPLLPQGLVVSGAYSPSDGDQLGDPADGESALLGGCAADPEHHRGDLVGRQQPRGRVPREHRRLHAHLTSTTPPGSGTTPASATSSAAPMTSPSSTTASRRPRHRSTTSTCAEPSRWASIGTGSSRSTIRRQPLRRP